MCVYVHMCIYVDVDVGVDVDVDVWMGNDWQPHASFKQALVIKMPARCS